jgi:hypothetical protein
MIVFGDHDRFENAAEVLARVLQIRDGAAGLPVGIERNDHRVRAFILAGELAQGIADRDFEARGCDADTPAQRACMQLLMHLAGLVLGREFWPMPGREEIGLVAAQGGLRLRTGEGHAFYALYPESHAVAAERSGLGPDTVVIGIRSIGAGLAAMVAAAMGAQLAWSVRPVGHPFSRELRICDSLKARLLANSDANFAIVDEGPGMSGSSFAAVIDWLRDHGVAPGHIHVFPSHGGEPGMKAGPGVRKNWRLVRKHPADQALFPGGSRDIARWFENVTGTADVVTDISGGEWRKLDHHDPWPPSDRRFERRKILIRAGERAFLAKFAGLGEAAIARMAAAETLAEAGFTPRPLALCHGFMLEEWHDGRPVDLAGDREALLATAARYAGFRARALKPLNRGAPFRQLTEMAVHNARLALGGQAADRLRQRLEKHAGAMVQTFPVHGDNRMHAWEWIVTNDGRLLKTDALDHACGHDLIGCQDVAWDVAGSIVEFGLSAPEANAFARQAGRLAARPVNAGLVEALTGCYLAFQLGSWTLAAQAGDQPETPRLLAAAERYKSLLGCWIADAASPAFDRNGSFTSITAPRSRPPTSSPNTAPAPRPPAATR